jgi:hypothetical protein
VLDLSLLSVRRLVELLMKVIVLRFEIIILTKEVQVRFIASLIWGILDGNVSRQWSGTFERELLECLPGWLGVL